MKLFDKKFKVKVSYFGSGYYQVKYAYYRFIPIYYALCFWFEQTLTGGTECWSTKLFKIEKAERVAKSLKGIEDVREWYKPYEEKERTFYKRQAEYYKKNVPYSSKQF
jgi:hypothetical protein